MMKNILYALLILATGCASKKIYYSSATWSDLKKVKNGMDPEHVKDIINRNYGHFSDCYQEAIDGYNVGFNGVVTLNFIIDKQGHVQKPHAQSSEGNLPDWTLKCLEEQITNIKFPPLIKANEVEFSQPFNFYIR